MATTNKRDVRLGVEIETFGEEGIRRLAEDVRRLGQAGGDLGPQFQAIATQLDRFAGQAGALTAFRKAAEDADRLAVAQREAAEAADKASAAFVEQRTAAEVLRAAQAKTAEALRTTKVEIAEAAARLSQFTTAASKDAKATDAYRERVEELRGAVDRLKIQRAELTAQLDRGRDAVRAAERAESTLAAQSERSAQAARAAGAALAERNSVLDRARAAALAAGASLDSLVDAETAVVAAVQDAAVATNRLVAEQRAAEASAAEGAEAMRRLEQAARAADAEFEQLAASLKDVETAAARYAAATERAAAAGADDVQAARARRAAAEALIDAERGLSGAQRELADQRDRSRAALLQEAQAFLAQARAANESRQATGRFVQEARQAGQAVESAFGTVGVRSLNAIETEIREVEIAMSRLERAMRAGTISQADLSRATAGAAARIRELKVEIATLPAGQQSAFARLGEAADDLVTKYGRLTAVAATVGFAVKPLLDATIALDQARRVLTTVTGSAEEAERQLEFLRRTAQASGQAFDQISESYSKFAASALQSGLTITQVQQVFESVSLAAGNLGLSTDQSKRALEALSQIASKGVVSMEELRQQLGDALPGVLPLLAKELGLTQAELNKVVEAGQLLAVEAIPAIGRSIRALGPANEQGINGIVASWNRFVNIVKEAGTLIVDGPIGTAAAGVLQVLGKTIGQLAFFAVSASEGIRVLGQTVGATAAFVAGGARDFDTYKETVSGFAEEAGARIRNFGERVAGTGQQTRALGQDVLNLGGSFARLAIDQQKAIDQAALTAQSAEKIVAARKKEAEAIVQVADLTADEVQQKEASARAAALVLEATEQQLAADRQVVAVLAETIEKQKADAQARYGNVEAIRTQVEALDLKLQKATADVEKTEASVRAARAAADAQDIAARSARDNALRIGELRQAVADATVAYEDSVRAARLDRATSEDVEKATRALAKAKGLLVDALKDQEDASRRAVDAIKAEAEVVKAQIELDIKKLEIKQAELEANGRLAEAARLDLDIKKLQVDLTRAGNDAKRAEAVEVIRTTTLKLQELRALGQLTPALEQELNTRIKSQQAILLQTQAVDLQTAADDKNREAKTRSNAQTQRHTRTTSENRAAVDESTQSLARQTTQYIKLAEASALWSARTVADYNKVKEAIDAVARSQAELDRYGPGANGGSGLGSLGGSSDVTRDGTAGSLVNPGAGNVLRGGGANGSSATSGGGSGTQYDPVSKFAIGVVGGFQLARPPGDGWTFVNDARAFGGTSPQDAVAGRYIGYTPYSTKLIVNGLGYWERSLPSGGGGNGPANANKYPTGYASPSAVASGGTMTLVVDLGRTSESLQVGGPSDAEAILRIIEEARLAGGGGA